MAAWNELPATGELDECAALVHSAETLRFSAPELAVQLARRALLVGASVTGAEPGIARPLSMRAQAVLASGLVAINRHVEAVAPAAAALAFAERGGAPDLAAAMRLDLAACAREVGEPLVGSGVLRPVLTDGRTRPAVRGRAIGRLVGCVAPIVRRDDVEDAIVEADRLFAADDGLSPDERRLERASLAVRTAAYHRWYGDVEDAIEVSRDGLSVLARVHEHDATSGRLRARLVLELICALLDNGELDEADSVARPVIDEPVRATSAQPVGRIMLAVSTRVHLPGGRVDLGRGLLDQVVRLAERHGHDSLLADALTTVSQLDERANRLAASLAALQSARAAEQRRLLAVAKAGRVLITEVDHGGRRGQTAAAANALLRQVLKHAVAVPAPQATEITQQIAAVPAIEARDISHDNGQDTDAATGLLNGEGLARRLRAVRTGDRPVALTLVRFEHGDHERGGTRDLAELANQVRTLAPAGAELARPAGTELAVLLPHTTLDQAEQLAATIGRTAIESADANGRAVTVSTGAAQSGEDTDALLTDARDALTPAERSAPAENTQHTTPPEHGHEANGTAIRRGLDLAGARESRTGGRSILNSLSIPSGSGGRRRVDRDEAADAPPGANHQEPTASRSGYETTKDELTRMMSALSAGTLRVPPSPTAGARNGTKATHLDRTVRQSLPTPPRPDDMPTPPTRPDIPEPVEPTPAPQPSPEPTEPMEPPSGPDSTGQHGPASPSWTAAAGSNTTADELSALWNGPTSLGPPPADPVPTTPATESTDSLPSRIAEHDIAPTGTAAKSVAAESVPVWGADGEQGHGAWPTDSAATGSLAERTAGDPLSWGAERAAPAESTAYDLSAPPTHADSALDSVSARWSGERYPDPVTAQPDSTETGSTANGVAGADVPAPFDAASQADRAETSPATEHTPTRPPAAGAAVESASPSGERAGGATPAAQRPSWPADGAATSATSAVGADLSALWARAENGATTGTAAADSEGATDLAALWARTGGRADRGTEPAATGPAATGPDTATTATAAMAEADPEPRRQRSTVPPPAPRAPTPADATIATARTGPNERIPRAERSDSTTIAGLLAEALAAYQTSVDEEQAEAAAQTADPIDELQQRTGAAGRHRSPE